MIIARAFLAALCVVAFCACTGGGGGETPAIPFAAWEKFRHDPSNTAQGSGVVATNNGQTKWRTQIDQSSISSSPALGADGTVYVGTEGGTLAALNPEDGSIKWSVSTCSFAGAGDSHACGAGEEPLGVLISSPAVYAFNARTHVFIGSASGKFFAFEDDSMNRACTTCFRPVSSDFPGTVIIAASKYVSSPSFTTDPTTNAISGMLIGAAIDIQDGGATRTVGKLYAINSDGSLKWQFPRPSDATIGAITSSPALGLAGALYFNAAAEHLYALTADGTFKWKFRVGVVSDALAPFDTSPLTATLIYTGTAAGAIVALNPDGSFRWRATSPDQSGFVGSLAVGQAAVLTPTPAPTAAETTTPPLSVTTTPTPTPTVALFGPETIYGVTKSGLLVAIETLTGASARLVSAPPTIPGPVVSSPALSADFYLVIGATDGTLHAVNTTTGAEPSGWPVQLAPSGVAIRSSPAIGTDGVIYVGADDGELYAIGTK